MDCLVKIPDFPLSLSHYLSLDKTVHIIRKDIKFLNTPTTYVKAAALRTERQEL